MPPTCPRTKRSTIPSLTSSGSVWECRNCTTRIRRGQRPSLRADGWGGSIDHGPTCRRGSREPSLDLTGWWSGSAKGAWASSTSPSSRSRSRRVALKIIKPGMDIREVIARFEAERQALAMMDHPNIAKVLDAGATESGRPYFVMELVKGSRSPRYCDEHKLTPRQTTGAVRRRLPGHPARPPEGRHSPGHQTVQRAGHAARRQAGAESHRLRCGQGDQTRADRADLLHEFPRWSARRCT